MTRSYRRLPVVLTAGLVSVALLAACSSGSSPVAVDVAASGVDALAPEVVEAPAVAPAPVHPPVLDPPATAARHAAGVSVTAVRGVGAPAALAASRALFTSASTVVVAPSGDREARESAAAASARLGVPVLLSGPGVAAAQLEAEARRLGAVRVVTIGKAPRLAGLTTVALASGGDLQQLGAIAGARPAAPADVVALVGDGPLPATALASVRAAGVPIVHVANGDPRATAESVKAIAAADPSHVITFGVGFGSAKTVASRVASASTGVQLPGGGQLIFPTGKGVRGKRYVALYGTPGSKALGVLGEQSVPKTITRATKTAAKYKSLTKAKVVPMVEIIATIASADAGKDGNYSRERSVDELKPLVEAARKKGLAVVLDLQPGRTDFLTQAKRYSSLLALPNVGLALDPEWRLKKDQVHLKQIGSVKIAEVNKTADWLAAFTRQHKLPQKLLVLHQFSLKMIVGRSKLKTSHDELALLIHVDGQGTQPAKLATWKALRANAPKVHWGWKNFIDEDKPMLSATKTYKIKPKPDLVTYQ
ncbi:MAG: hypothetical protein AAGC49_12530 [Brevundimonas sp.]